MSGKSEEVPSGAASVSVAPRQESGENEAKRRVSLSVGPEAKRIKKEPPATATAAEATPGAGPANDQQLAVKPKTPSVAAVPATTVAAKSPPTETSGTAIQCKQEPLSTAAVTTTERLVATKPTTDSGSGDGGLDIGQIAAAYPLATMGTRVSPDLVRTKVVLGTSASDPVEEKKNAAAATAVSAKSVQAAATTGSSASGAPPAQPPLKALKMSHLRTKYTSELEYMLREFRKLERQLLGAKGATQIEESAGSRERREKLHSFIIHLEDTIRQIELGCKLEAEGKSTVSVGVAGPDQQGNTAASSDAAVQAQAKRNRADSSALSNLTQEKEEEENVQKLEEHILANLLPVKVRLKKQLAAQQGATKNPAGMPAMRRGSLLPAESDRGKGTFAAAAEQRRREAEALAAQQHVPAEPVHPDNTHFGKPLGRRGSSLTQKLHGQTLGSRGRPHGHGVGLSKPATEELVDGTSRNIMYAGVAPGSKQVASGVAVASSVHKMVIDIPHLQNTAADTSRTHAAKSELVTKAATAVTPQKTTEASIGTTATKLHASQKVKVLQYPKTAASKPAPRPANHNIKALRGIPEIVPSATTKAIKQKLDDPTLTDDERKKLRRKLKKKLLLRRAKRREFERQRQAALLHSAQVAPKAGVGRKKSMGGKVNGKKRGPRSVEYICALCSEAYSSVCDYNPWWALSQHECPKCRKNQIPRVDISAPANAIEYHPALLAHADDGGASVAAAAATEQVVPAQMPSPSKYPVNSLHAMSGETKYASDSEFGSDLSDITDGNLSDVSLDSNDSDADVLASLTPAEKAEHERFGFEYKGPKLSDSEASRLLVLMLHANGCPCRHKNQKQRDVCRSTKFMMLHVRDCHGTTSNFDVCPFPWCRKVKHLLYHLVSCAEPLTCSICSPTDLPKGMDELIGLNNHRLKRQRDRIIASYKARQQQLKIQHQALKPPAVAATKKTVSQRAQHVGDPSSKPRAVASRAKPRAAAPATKPAATAARKTGSVFPGATAVLAKVVIEKPLLAKLAIAKPISAGIPIAGASRIQASAAAKTPLQQQPIVQNPLPGNAKPALNSRASQSSVGAATAVSVAPVKTLPAPEAQIPTAALSPMPVQAYPVTAVRAPPIPVQAATLTSISTTAAPIVPSATMVEASSPTKTMEVVATAAIPLPSIAVAAQAPASLQATPVAVAEAASVALCTAAPLAASVATSATTHITGVNGPTSVTSLATPTATARSNIAATATTVAPAATAKPVKEEEPAALTTAGSPGTKSVQAAEGTAIFKGIKTDEDEAEGPKPSISGEGITLATQSVTASSIATKDAGTVESPATAVKLEEGTTSTIQPPQIQTNSDQSQAPEQESQATPTSMRSDVNCTKKDIAKPPKEPIKSC